VAQTTGISEKPSARLEESVSSPMALFITPEKGQCHYENCNIFLRCKLTYISIQKTTETSAVDPIRLSDKNETLVNLPDY
jgi:hypothetical protein